MKKKKFSLKELYRFLFKIIRVNASEKLLDMCVEYTGFSLVGLSNTIILYVVYLIFIKLNCHYIVANIIAFVASTCNAFYWNDRYVFKNQKDDKASLTKKYIKMFVSYTLTGFILANALLYVWVDVLNVNKIYGPLINVIITTPINFVLNKFWSFK